MGNCCRRGEVEQEYIPSYDNLENGQLDIDDKNPKLKSKKPNQNFFRVPDLNLDFETPSSFEESFSSLFIKRQQDKTNNEIIIKEIPMDEFNKKYNSLQKSIEIISKNSSIIDNSNQLEEEKVYNLKPLSLTRNYFINENEYFVGKVNKKGELTGKGMFISKDDDIYRGYFKQDVFNGKGIYVKNNGEYYVGDWVNGACNGKGILILEDGTKYEGDFKDNMKHGKGKETYSDGTEYIGDYYKNLKNGKGTIKYKDDNYYTGDFKNDKLEGFGEYHWNNGNLYKGEFSNNIMNGKGETYWTDGSVFKGDYINGYKNGYGIYNWPDGRVFKGYWNNNEPNGSGEFFVNGTKYEANFVNGNLFSIKSEKDKAFDSISVYETPNEIDDPHFKNG